jgi:hypothetical protein
MTCSSRLPVSFGLQERAQAQCRVGGGDAEHQHVRSLEIVDRDVGGQKLDGAHLDQA